MAKESTQCESPRASDFEFSAKEIRLRVNVFSSLGEVLKAIVLKPLDMFCKRRPPQKRA